MEAAVEPAKTIDLESSRAVAKRSNGKKSERQRRPLILLKELDDLKALLDNMNIRYVEAACDSVAQCA
ncbi:hypothetical protein QR680_015111 [Steinernema hermaphroditum]|uniref:Uncharacterized protein n=1 Tax=Steinernema hermaphroditum TaxID=289476 RepID=A0AA39M5E5_9BILA|nr:hypothetical protein QR680_015111 [Steinernema hermaphroditum]